MVLIHIWVLIANAMIEVVERTGKRYLRMSAVDTYLNAIQQKIPIRLDWRRAYGIKQDMPRDLFELSEVSGDIILVLKDGVTAKDLRETFRVQLSLKTLEAFVDRECIQALLAANMTSLSSRK